MYCGFHKKKKKLNSTTVFNTNNNRMKCFHTRMISEGSCDTEDWSNDCFYITAINYILKYIKIENSYFKL